MDIESTSLLAERQQIMLKVEFLLGLFFKKWPESFCIILTKGSVPRIGKNIFKKVSQKIRNFLLKIGYNSGCNIKYTWLLKVKYLLNGAGIFTKLIW